MKRVVLILMIFATGLMGATWTQFSLNSGELSDLSGGIIHAPEFYSGLRTAENVVVGVHGWAEKRPGLYYISQVTDSNVVDAVLGTYKYTYISENGSIWGIPFDDTDVVRLDVDDAVNVGGGIVGINYNNADEAGNLRFVEGDVVDIKGTTNYESTHTLTAGTTATQLQFTDTYVAETFDGTETVSKYVGSLTASIGRMVGDSSYNVYFGHNWDAANSTYVTKMSAAGAFDYTFLNHGWGSSASTVQGLAITSDDAYLYVLLAGNVEKYSLATGNLEWTTNPTGDSGFNIALDADGNCYVCPSGTTGKMAKLASADGSETLLTSMGNGGGAQNGCVYDVHVDDTLGIVCGGGTMAKLKIGSPDTLYNFAVRTFDDSAGDQVQIGGYYESGALWVTYTVGSEFITSDGEYIYVLCHTPNATIYKYSWDGSSLTEEDTVAGPTYAAGLFFDIYGNLVVVNVDWINLTTDRYYFYDSDLTLLGTADPFSTLQLKPWDAAVGGVYGQGGVVDIGYLGTPAVGYDVTGGGAHAPVIRIIDFETNTNETYIIGLEHLSMTFYSGE